MTLSIKFATGFENGLATGNAEGSLSGPNGILAAAKRTGDYGLDIDASDDFTVTPFPFDFTKAFHVGFAIRHVGSFSAAVALLDILESTTTNYFNFYMDASGSLTVGKDNTQTGAPTPAYSCGSFTVDTWHYVEITALIHNSAGAIKIKIDGVQTLDVSGIDTQNSATAPTAGNNAILKFEATVSKDLWIDDLVMAEASSTTLEFLGEVAILPGRPDSSVTSDMTGSDGNQVNNHLLVDEDPPDTADYVESATVGHKDTYGTDLAIASGTTILGVAVKSYALKDDGGARTMGLYIKENATADTSAGKGLSTSPAIISEIWEVNPDTSSAWTVTAVNAAEIGVEIVS